MKKAKSFTRKIQNFSQEVRRAKQGGIFKTLKSYPFYTERCGYKMQLLLYPNGAKSAENTHISLYHSVIKGEYDASLTWPFNTAVKFTLIDQQSIFQQNVNYSFAHNVTERPRENMCSSLGTHEFITHEKLKTRRYLVDDTLFLRVVIDPDSTQLNWWSTYPLSKPVKI